jgi:hypothetical protein
VPDPVSKRVQDKVVANRHKWLGSWVKLLDRESELSSLPPKQDPIEPRLVSEMLQRGQEPSLFALIGALRGTSREFLWPEEARILPDDIANLLDHIADRFEAKTRRPGRPTNEYVKLARCAIGYRVYRWRRIFTDRYKLVGNSRLRPKARSWLPVWGVVGSPSPHSAAMEVVRKATGLTPRHVQQCADEYRDYVERYSHHLSIVSSGDIEFVLESERQPQDDQPAGARSNIERSRIERYRQSEQRWRSPADSEQIIRSPDFLFWVFRGKGWHSRDRKQGVRVGYDQAKARRRAEAAWRSIMKLG